MTQTDNKRVAKNAVALTLRMILVTIVGLYTSRIVLEALGVEDYGIYGVIGGVVGMASFLNSSMAGATSRFITFELGHGDESKLKKIFSTSLIIHIAIALIVFVLAETIGLWFVNNKMNFPDGKMFAVNVLYQFTIISMMVNFTQVPYSAAIIAHEKMSIYAYFEIINVVLKIAIATMLLFVSSNKLILYASLMMAVSIVSALIYRIYCIRHFKETKSKPILYKSISKEILTFTGFDLYGNMCAVANAQGQPLILNMFFGVIANAGSSIAYTITGAIGSLTRTVASAFKPQIIKKYAIGDIEQMTLLMRRSIQFTLIAYSSVALPIFFTTDKVIFLWLGQVPPYSVEFFRLIVISVFIDICIVSNNTAIHATGNIKNISFISGSFYLLSPVLSYLIIRFWLHNAAIVYLANILMLVIVLSLGWIFIKKQIPQFTIKPYVSNIIKTFCGILLSFLITYFVVWALDSRWSPSGFFEYILYIIIIGMVGICVIFIISSLFIVNKAERKIIETFIQTKVHCLLKS